MPTVTSCLTISYDCMTETMLCQCYFAKMLMVYDSVRMQEMVTLNGKGWKMPVTPTPITVEHVARASV